MIVVRKRHCPLCLFAWPTWVVYDSGGLYFCTPEWLAAVRRADEIARAKQPGTGVQVQPTEKVSHA